MTESGLASCKAFDNEEIRVIPVHIYPVESVEEEEDIISGRIKRQSNGMYLRDKMKREEILKDMYFELSKSSAEACDGGSIHVESSSYRGQGYDGNGSIGKSKNKAHDSGLGDREAKNVVKRAKNASNSGGQGRVVNTIGHGSAEHKIRQHNNSNKVLPPTQHSNQTTCYVVVGPQPAGKFDPVKAREYGLKPGPQYKELVAGKSVFNEEGKEIKPEMVVGKKKPRSVFLVVECHDSRYIESIVRKEEFLKYHIKTVGNGKGENAESDEELKLIIHLLDDVKVLDNSKYLEWIKGFGHGVKHMICNREIAMEECSTEPFERFYNLQKKLGKINNRVFRVPEESNKKKGSKPIKHRNINGIEFLVADYNLKIDFEPNFAIDTTLMSQPVQQTNNVAEENSFNDDAGVGATEMLMDKNENFIISTLGTGSSIPSCHRNVSSNLVYMKGSDSYILLDCGEGTSGQIKRLVSNDMLAGSGVDGDEALAGRRFNEKEYAEIIRKLKMLYISHMHADHHLGTVQILLDYLKYSNAHNAQKDAALVVVGPLKFYKFLKEIETMLDVGFGDKILFINNHDLLMANSVSQSSAIIAHRHRWIYDKLLKDLNLKELKTCLANHCLHSYCLLISAHSSPSSHSSSSSEMMVEANNNNTFQLVYSGDTRPTRRIVDLVVSGGNNNDVTLLHEATMYDDMLGDAIAKKHSTCSEALAVAISMGAKRLLLTHFSQRYIGIPRSFNVEMVLNTILSAGSADSPSIKVSEYLQHKLSDPSGNNDINDIKSEHLGLSPKSYVEKYLESRYPAFAFDLAIYSPSDIEEFVRLAPAIYDAASDEVNPDSTV
ncbi:Zinc phosphodiesterase ELAC protein 2 [Zancudomyces culisetae]|uniref:ribonuclease Z n=1 Tax=Zancudomyces culisetae TaxID=1213189 RepID=A0A1R1PHN8_ZANCU|nr:Zinc phosphodiesterase ELAC protein 2 [Zancudomyces culisetae]|eukprot:OMH80467.1 Zinc phosphodiesterase ELAC protein 2 [Zancudomyces culisetae]